MAYSRLAGLGSSRSRISPAALPPLLALFGLVAQEALAQSRPEDRTDFWESNYTVLAPDSAPRVARAYEVFERVLRAAGTRPGVVPRLLVIKKNELEVLAIPDGGVILTSAALDRCYLNSSHGDDRLAFLLGHEIAHELKEDFWHVRFFQALESPTGKPGEKELRDEVRKIAARTDDVLAKELAADEHGVVYSAQAGFDPSAVLAEDGRVNFFAEWVAALDPTRLSGAAADPTHPSPAQRAETVRVRLKAVLAEVEIFDWGVLFYEAGDFEHAGAAFRNFLTTFPSREVYHNLGACEHQLALHYFREWKSADSNANPAAPDKGAMPFRLPLVVDPTTRASQLMLKRGGAGGQDPEALFREHLGSAIESYRTALAQDPDYTPTTLNLASALVLSGESDEAVALLNRAGKKSAPSAEQLDVLAVAYYYTDRSAKAHDALSEARTLDPRSAPVLFNLARLTALEGHAEQAAQLWKQYLELDGSSAWAAVARQNAGLAPASSAPTTLHGPAESVAGGRVGAYDDEMPKTWGAPQARPVALGKDACQISVYPNQLETASCKQGKVMLIAVREGAQAKTARGVGLGTARSTVESAYGAPSDVLDLTSGKVLVYEEAGIAFRVVDDKVASWVVFRG